MLAAGVLLGVALDVNYRLSPIWTRFTGAWFYAAFKAWVYGGLIADVCLVSAIFMMAGASTWRSGRLSRWGARLPPTLAIIWLVNRLLETLWDAPDPVRSVTWRLAVGTYLGLALWGIGLLLLRSLSQRAEPRLYGVLIAMQLALTGMAFNWFVLESVSTWLLGVEFRFWYLVKVTPTLHSLLWAIVFGSLLYYLKCLRRRTQDEQKQP